MEMRFLTFWEQSFLDFSQLEPSMLGQLKTPVILLRTLPIVSNHIMQESSMLVKK